MTASANNMWIAFVTDSSVHGRGFSADYYTTCGGTFTQNNTVFTSPGFPGVYPHAVDCEYFVVAPETDVVTLTFAFGYKKIKISSL